MELTLSTELSGPTGLDVDVDGNVFVANFNDGVITKISPDGTVVPFVDLGNSMAASNVIVNDDGSLWVSSYGNNKIYKVSALAFRKSGYLEADSLVLSVWQSMNSKIFMLVTTTMVKFLKLIPIKVYPGSRCPQWYWIHCIPPRGNLCNRY